MAYRVDISPSALQDAEDAYLWIKFNSSGTTAEAAGIWPEDEGTDDFAAAVREWRQEGRQREFDVDDK